MKMRRKSRKLALMLSVTMLLSTVCDCRYGMKKATAYAASEKETIHYFAEGLGTGADFSQDNWEMKTDFPAGTETGIIEKPDYQPEIVENEHSGKNEKILRLINARALALDSAEEPDAWSRVSTAVIGERFSLKDSSEFSAKFTVSMPDACINKNLTNNGVEAREAGGDGIAFVITPASSIRGSVHTGMGYYGIKDSLAIELDSHFNGAYCNLETPGGAYVNWAYDNQIYANKSFGYLQSVADNTRNHGVEYDWDSSYWDYLNPMGYAMLPASRERRFDHVGVVLDGEVRDHYGISYLNGLKPDQVEGGQYVNINDSQASTSSSSSKCETRFADEGDINVVGEEVDNRLFTVWVEYDGINLFVRYANGSFSEAVRPEEPQIELLEKYDLEQKFASEDVSIGFVSSISSEDGSAASHTIHSVAFANEYIENGISAEYIYNKKLTAAKEVVQGVLDGISVDNDTTKEDVQHTIDTALDQAGITDVTVTVGDLTKTEAALGVEGSVESVISFECGTIMDHISMIKIIPMLPTPAPTAAPTETPTVTPAAPTETPSEMPPTAPAATLVPPTVTPAGTSAAPTDMPVGTPIATLVPPTSTPEGPVGIPTVTPAVPTVTPMATLIPATQIPVGTPAATSVPSTETPIGPPVATSIPGTFVPPTEMPPAISTMSPIGGVTDPPLGTPRPLIVSRDDQESNSLTMNAGLKVSQTGKKINVIWGAVPGADGYDVYVQYCGKKFTERSVTAIKNAGTTKTSIRKVNRKALNLKKNYKIYVLAYKLADGKKVTLATSITAYVVGRNNKTYTNAKAVKIKKSVYQLKKGKTARILADTVLAEKGKRKLTDVHAKEFRYASADKRVAVVSAKGKIKAVGKGKCSIYVYARNGYAKKIKVIVR